MTPDTRQEIVQIRDATVRIGQTTILGPITFTVRAGESWVILGPNGAGKTTLLDLVGAIHHPTSGTIDVLGSRVGRVDVRTLRSRIGFVGHHVADAIPAHLPVVDIVLTGKRSTLVPWMQTFDENDRRTAAELLERVGCTPMTARPLASCSQGERQRVMLARALFGRPELLLLDEPMAGLDLPGRELLLDALSSTAHSAPPTILVTHHLEEIPRTVTHAALMRTGITVADGPIEAVLTDEQVSACFGIPISVSSTQGRWSGHANDPGRAGSVED